MTVAPRAPGRDPSLVSARSASAEQQAADYVAGMTDRFALATHDRLFRPTLNL
jgi:dGTP triphosphohydrolase